MWSGTSFLHVNPLEAAAAAAAAEGRAHSQLSIHMQRAAILCASRRSAFHVDTD